MGVFTLMPMIDTPLLSLPDPKPSSLPHTPTPTQHSNSSCKELLEAGQSETGIFTIVPAGFSDGLRVCCDMETDGGGWIIIQRRQDGSVDFYRNWIDYRVGFGDLNGEFWLGNDNLRKLTETVGMWQLRFDLENWFGEKAWSEHEGFRISGENFRLNVDSYNEKSPADYSILCVLGASWHDGMMFSTKNKQNDKNNCAERFHWAWWYDDCCMSNLNGRYYVGGTLDGERDGIH
ncbi:ryncolin-2-like [Asterias rubens]|uniref:ryncolin-2-like n=1 Tax=Asterias rubens TaxID=7604 RepID=UPI0014557389|nr:ryncolin-2-like [Asterias rubens]